MEFLHPLYYSFLNVTIRLSQDDLNHCQHCPGSSGGTGIITQTYNTRRSNLELQRIRNELQDQGMEPGIVHGTRK